MTKSYKEESYKLYDEIYQCKILLCENFRWIYRDKPYGWYHYSYYKPYSKKDPCTKLDGIWFLKKDKRLKGEKYIGTGDDTSFLKELTYENSPMKITDLLKIVQDKYDKLQKEYKEVK